MNTAQRRQWWALEASSVSYVYIYRRLWYMNMSLEAIVTFCRLLPMLRLVK